MNGENFRDGEPLIELKRFLEAWQLARSVNPYVRVVLVNETGQRLTDDEKRQLNISLGRDPEKGIGEDSVQG